MTDEVCTRCKGKGFFRADAGVQHYGVPGLCWGCDGVGTKAGQVAKKAAQAEYDRLAAARYEAERQRALDEQKIRALAAYNAHEMGLISRRRRDGVIRRAMSYCVTEYGFTEAEFKAHAPDEIAVAIATGEFDSPKEDRVAA